MSYQPRRIADVETKIRLKTKIRLEIRSGTRVLGNTWSKPGNTQQKYTRGPLNTQSRILESVEYTIEVRWEKGAVILCISTDIRCVFRVYFG